MPNRPKLCVDVAKVKKAAELDLDKLLARNDAKPPQGVAWKQAATRALGATAVVRAAFALDSGIVLVATLCAGDDGCELAIARFAGTGATAEIVGEPMSRSAGAAEPDIHAAIVDHDGDGHLELWVRLAARYSLDDPTVDESERGGREMNLIVLSLRDLKPIVEVDLGNVPVTDEGEKCQTSIYRIDLSCDKQPDLLTLELCAKAICFPDRVALDTDYSLYGKPEAECAGLEGNERNECEGELEAAAESRAMVAAEEGEDPDTEGPCFEEDVDATRSALVWQDGAYHAVD